MAVENPAVVGPVQPSRDAGQIVAGELVDLSSVAFAFDDRGCASFASVASHRLLLRYLVAISWVMRRVKEVSCRVAVSSPSSHLWKTRREQKRTDTQLYRFVEE